MKCCGINAIEAQISGEDWESIGERIVSEAKEECAVDRGITTPAREQKKGSHGERKEGGEEIPRWPHENGNKLSSGRAKGGFKGFFSSVASLGGSKAGQADDGDDETKSETSQRSALSFLSNGLKKLTSKGENLMSLARGLSQQDGVSATCEPLSLGDTGVTVIEHDQSYSTSDSAALIVQGGREERCSLAEIVRFRAARSIQCQVRMRQARKAVIQHQASARAARLRWEEHRLQQRKREVDAKKRYKELCREEGESVVTEILSWSVNRFMRPRAAVDIQRVWRGYRVRKRLTTNLKSLECRRRKRKEYERYLAALVAIRGSRDSRKGQVKRRVWGRTEFIHSGWKPLYEAEDLSNMHDYVWKPPRGSTSGVRTYKVILPPRSEAERRMLTEDKNAWAGVLVGISRKPPPPERLGPPPRPGTMGATRAMPPSEVGEGRQMVAKYNWLPAPLLSKAGLLQTPLKVSITE